MIKPDKALGIQSGLATLVFLAYLHTPSILGGLSCAVFVTLTVLTFTMWVEHLHQGEIK